MKANGTVHKYGDNVDTDVIIPARYLAIQDRNELAEHAMEDIECPQAAAAIKNGDQVEVDFDSGEIKDLTSGETFQGAPFPEFMQKIIVNGGLINYINNQ